VTQFVDFRSEIKIEIAWKTMAEELIKTGRFVWKITNFTKHQLFMRGLRPPLHSEAFFVKICDEYTKW
jgi:hypothetical protein